MPAPRETFPQQDGGDRSDEMFQTILKRRPEVVSERMAQVRGKIPPSVRLPNQK
jgi:hypothetical protein